MYGGQQSAGRHGRAVAGSTAFHGGGGSDETAGTHTDKGGGGQEVGGNAGPRMYDKNRADQLPALEADQESQFAVHRV